VLLVLLRIVVATFTLRACHHDHQTVLFLRHPYCPNTIT
jgi:hypothetical protein